MTWEKLTAALTALFSALMPYLEKLALLYAGSKWQQADTASQTLTYVQKANEAVAAHAADSTADRLQRARADGRLRGFQSFDDEPVGHAGDHPGD